MSNSEGHSSCWETLREIVNMFPNVDTPTSMVRSYYVPNSQERTTIIDLIASQDLSIKTLESTIIDMRMAISLLEVQLSEYKKCRMYQASLLSPVRRLPDELLAHIFSYACEGGIDVARFESTGSLWDIRDVCIRWRNVAEHTPHLWCNFEIKHKHIEAAEHNTLPAKLSRCFPVMQRTQLCLNNSRSLPLTISCNTETFCRNTILALTEVGKHSDRWGSLKTTGMWIDSICETGMDYIIQNCGLGMLRSLTVKGRLETLSSFRIFKHAPALREVSLLDDMLLPDVQDFPWSLIKVLYLSECHMETEDRLIPIFEAMTSLEMFTWEANFFYRKATKSILLPSLHTISIVYNDVEELMAAYEDDGDPPMHLPLFYAPRLTTIQITGDTILLAALVSIVRNSGNSFTHLILQDNSSNFIMNAITEFSTVQDLTVTGEEYDVLLEHLRQPSLMDELIPSLQRLNLPGLESGVLSSKEYLLEDVMRCRCRSPHPAALELDGQEDIARTGQLSYVSIARGGKDSNNCRFLSLKALGEKLEIMVEYREI